MSSILKRLLLIPHLKVHNANALSSPYTIGFPAMTAWLGAVHALQRKLNHRSFADARFSSVAVVCHQINLQTYKGEGDYIQSIIGTGNPLDKTGARSAFIEEARCDLDVSVLIEYKGIEKDEEDHAIKAIRNALLGGMKMASGDILDFNKPEFLKVEEGNDKDLRSLTRRLMPGYTIIERRELMVDAMQQGQDAIDAMLDYLKVMHRSEAEDDKVSWTSKRKASGWLVPIATGFHGVTETGQAKNQRDPDTAHRFAESVVTLGEFVMPYRIQSVDNMLWHYHVEPERDLYLCQQNDPVATSI